MSGAGLIEVDRKASLPIYSQIERHFAGLIERGRLKPGERLPGVPTLMRRIGVNYRTVRQAYQGLEQRGLVRVEKGRGTFVAQETDSTATRCIAVLHSDPLEIESEHQYYTHGVWRGIREELEASGLQVRYEVVEPGNDRWLDAGDGFIVFAARTSTAAVVERLTAAGKPVVATAGEPGHCPVVKSDDGQGIGLLMEHLFELGHRRIALINASADWFSGRLRLDAYCRKMAERGLPMDPSWIHSASDFYMEQPAEQEQLWQWMFERPNRPTAVVACTAYLAMSVLQMLHRHRLYVPQEVSVCGFDDPRAAAFCCPALTTVRQALEQIGRQAVRTLTRLMEGGQADDTLLPVDLVIRESTGKTGDL